MWEYYKPQSYIKTINYKTSEQYVEIISRNCKYDNKYEII